MTNRNGARASTEMDKWGLTHLSEPKQRYQKEEDYCLAVLF